jgi:hypothetical protein
MSKRMLYMSVVAVLAASGAAISNPAPAMPLAGALAVADMAGTGATPVWYYREWGYGPVDAEEEEEPRYYRPYRYYYYDAYDGPSYGYTPRYHRDDYAPRYYRTPVYRGNDMTDYCASRYRSWDPETGTYLGYDGLRHPCP